jgi:hypothetical protein
MQLTRKFVKVDPGFRPLAEVNASWSLGRKKKPQLSSESTKVRI